MTWVQFKYAHFWHARPHFGAATLCGWLGTLAVGETAAHPPEALKCKRCLELIQLTLWRSDQTR